MSVNYNLPTITNRLNQVLNALDGGGSAGVLRLLDGGGNILSSMSMAFPAATVSGNVLTFLGLSLIDPSAAQSGVAQKARIEDSTGTIVISGLTVGGPGTGQDITLSPTNTIIAGQVIALQQATITGQ